MNHNCQHSIEGVGSLGALRASPFNHPSSQSAHDVSQPAACLTPSTQLSCTMSSRIPAITLHNGGKMPMVGLGTYKSRDDEIRQALNVALECGYRHIDTATVYENEVEIGDVLHEWLSSGRIAREELFVVTKLPMTGNRYKDVGRFLQDSLDKLRLSYVDLYLIHSPVGMKEHSKGEFDLDTNHEEIYKAMEEQNSRVFTLISPSRRRRRTASSPEAQRHNAVRAGSPCRASDSSASFSSAPLFPAHAGSRL
ncbi:hypothetical protein C7M84_024963 [Penaeus vannamei]|uniref:NADP-dependent oxidoreductase domain-containing protein n=1 Tax=Penaeus vannamei TaxID=6689 RepID=A0A423TZI1_PENVA|nr:hypothetical protein C7M84_024963 [Penaeus vannamei]